MNIKKEMKEAVAAYLLQVVGIGLQERLCQADIDAKQVIVLTEREALNNDRLIILTEKVTELEGQLKAHGDLVKCEKDVEECENKDALLHQPEKSSDSTRLLRDLVTMIDHDFQLIYGAYLTDLSEYAVTKLSSFDVKAREAIQYLITLDKKVS